MGVSDPDDGIERLENEGGPVTNDDDLMTPSEVAEFFNVDPKTVTRWAKAGKIPSFRTVGGHRRFPRKQIEAIREGTSDGDHDNSNGAA
jgi:excisionase family DNA binding protein